MARVEHMTFEIRWRNREFLQEGSGNYKREINYKWLWIYMRSNNLKIKGTDGKMVAE